MAQLCEMMPDEKVDDSWPRSWSQDRDVDM